MYTREYSAVHVQVTWYFDFANAGSSSTVCCMMWDVKKALSQRLFKEVCFSRLLIEPERSIKGHILLLHFHIPSTIALL